jgi:acetyl esterase
MQGMPFRHLRRVGKRIRSRAGALVVDNLFRAASAAGRLHPQARPERHRVEVLRDIDYVGDGAAHHRLDIYRPVDRPAPLGSILYLHGGGFRILSKDSHWIMGLAFARQGYLVAMANYRLAPRHPYPAAAEDACLAWAWAKAQVASYGGDPERLAVAGESAGANLSCAIAVATSWKRREAWALGAWNAGSPRAVLPACGLLQVSDTARFARRRKLPAFLADRMTEVETAYLGANARALSAEALEMADPLCVIERGAPERPLPPFFAAVGTADPLLDDTRRLKAALDRLGVECDARYYEGEVHAFHALVFRPNARRCWKATYEFLEKHL